jgi:hypothetical protein
MFTQGCLRSKGANILLKKCGLATWQVKIVMPSAEPGFSFKEMG